MRGGNRSWWYYSSNEAHTNDACQGFAAQSISQRLGSPVETTVWPGATIPTAYLYWKIPSPIPKTNGNVVEVESLLSESVYFHWKLAAIYCILFIWLFYLFVYRITGSNLLGLVSSIVIAINPWYAFQATQIRPEMLSMLWLFGAAHVAICKPSDAHALMQNLLFGLCVGLAIFSKIQILPLVACCVVLYYLKRWNINSNLYKKPKSGGGLNITIILLTMVVSFGFLKSYLIKGASYQLPEKPKIAGLIVFICIAIFLVISLKMLFGKSNHPAYLFTQFVEAIGGGVLALLVITFPNFIFGGFTCFISSINTILFGIASFAVYGLSLSSSSGWGQAKTFADKINAFSAFQKTSNILFVETKNTMIVFCVATLALVILAKTILKNRKYKGVIHDNIRRTRENINWATWVILIAVLLDFTMTNRTVRNSVYGFYHIYTIPLYILAITLALRSVWFSLSRSESLQDGGIGIALLVYSIAFVAIDYYPNAVPQMTEWKAAEEKPEKYTKQLSVIGGVSPSFFKRTNITYEALVARVLSHTPPTSVPPANPPISVPLPVAKPPAAVPAPAIPPAAPSP